ncbi:MAG: SDR family oxidoreductase [Myxococcales bacterium]|nr:SDR family oxidoreductase [Myxococcales bacterium]
MNSYDFRGKRVLITGASMGIGERFARILAARGAKLILVARSKDKLEALARELGDAAVIAEDLAAPGSAERVLAQVRALGLTVDVLVNNAGFGKYGSFDDVPLDELRSMVDLNVRSLVEMTHEFMPMLVANRGGVIQVASTAAFQPVPYMAVYGASKAFVLSFSEALWAEYRPRGVRVLALCPGATETPFFARAGEAAAFGAKASPDAVVALGLDAFSAGRASVIHGAGNNMVAAINRLFPRAMVAKISARLMQPKPALPAVAS